MVNLIFSIPLCGFACKVLLINACSWKNNLDPTWHNISQAGWWKVSWYDKRLHLKFIDCLQEGVLISLCIHNKLLLRAWICLQAALPWVSCTFLVIWKNKVFITISKQYSMLIWITYGCFSIKHMWFRGHGCCFTTCKNGHPSTSSFRSATCHA